MFPRGSTASLLVWRLLPATIGLPVLVGTLRIEGELLGWYSANVGHAIMITTAIVAGTSVLLWTAVSVERIDRKRRAAQDALARSHAQHRALARNFPDGALVLFDHDLRHVIADGAGLASVGLSAERMEGRTIWEVFPREVAAALEPSYRSALAGSDSTFTYPYGDRTYLVRVVPVRDPGSGDVTGGAVVVQDVTVRRQAEAELRHLDERFTRVFDNAPIGEAIVAPDGRYLQVNRALCELVGYSEDELLATTYQAITHPDDLDADVELARQVLAGELRTYELEKRYIHRQGHEIHVLLSASLVRGEDGEPPYFVAQMQDISGRKAAEEERDRLQRDLHHAQKLEAIGQLAGGVAHEFNNMLMAISAHAGLVLERLEPESPARRDVEQILGSAERAAGVTRQLLAFGRKQVLQHQAFDPNEVVEAAVELLRPLIDPRIGIITRLDPASPPVVADPAQIQQVIVNLVLNARDAIEGEGTITISTEAVEVGAGQAGQEGVQPGAYVALTVADTGCGMDETTRSRLFEPFFTTKADGTGLGLATAYGIVRQGGGFLAVESEAGRGTAMRVVLAAGSVAESAPAAQPESPEPARFRGTAVVVDDETAVRYVCAELLVRLGYSVRTACDGLQALALLEAQPASVDLLLTDVVMPGLDGPELARRLAATHPETTVVFMSGYPGDGMGTDEAAPFLEKPFTARDLEETLSALVPGRAEPLTCVVADDHPSVLDAICRVLAENGADVLSGHDSAQAALEAIARLRPRVALLDVAMPGMGGVEAARRVRESSPGTRVLLYTGYGERSLVSQALSAGAQGVVLKDAPLDELVSAVRVAAAGGIYVDRRLSGALVPASGPREPEAGPVLTAREHDVLRLVADGQTNDQVAATLGISPDTVQTHVRNAMKKLGAETRTQAVATAMRRAIIG